MTEVDIAMKGMANPKTTTPEPTQLLQPIPTLSIEAMPDKKWLRLEHPGVIKHFTMAECEAIAAWWNANYGSVRLTYEEGYQAGLGDGAEQGNLRARA